MEKKSKKLMNLKHGKCDVLIPVYNAPEWTKLCVYSLFVNTPLESLGKVYLLNDNSDLMTKECLENLKRKHPEHIEIINNKKNVGFVKNVNQGLKLANSDFILLLNTDCIIARNTIPKLISHLQKDRKIGLISPISNNAANLSLEIFDGFSYNQMDSLLEKKFKGINFDACTVVGNCLMLTKKCVDQVGLLDESYGSGYGEETDYQFKAMEKGFKAKVAIDTYVLHESGVSFGSSKDQEDKIRRNRDLFFSRWKAEYEKEAQKYEANNPVKYIQSHIAEDDKNIIADTLFFLPGISQNAGGCHVVIDIVNRLVINSLSANVLYDVIEDYREILLFKPISRKLNQEFSTKQIVSTVWLSTFWAKKIAEEKKVPIISFVQGYENYFENASIFNSVKLTHKIADYQLTISSYLKKKLKRYFDIEPTLIRNGVEYDLLHHDNKHTSAKEITFVLRGNPMKGDYILLDIIHQVDTVFKDLVINVVSMDETVEIPSIKNNTLNKISGPLPKIDLFKILKKTDIYVDASVNEGFGLIGLEAMTAGAVPIMSNSFGVQEYLKDGISGYLIKEVNDPDKYIEKISKVVKDNSLFSLLKTNCSKEVASFDFDLVIPKYIEYFNEEKKCFDKKFSKEEREIIRMREESEPKVRKSLVSKIIGLFPTRIKNILKGIITRLYNMYEHK